MSLAELDDNANSNLYDARRMCDIAIIDTLGSSPTVIIDVTYASPVADHIKEEYKPELAADCDVAIKRAKYKSKFDVDDNSKAKLILFGVETSGALEYQARHFCKNLAELKQTDNFTEIKQIYERLSVTVQVREQLR